MVERADETLAAPWSPARWSADERAAVARLAGQLLADPPGDADLEIAVARLALARLLREEADPTRLAAGVARVVAVVLRARQVARAGAAAGGEWGEVADRILAELGLGTED